MGDPKKNFREIPFWKRIPRLDAVEERETDWLVESLIPRQALVMMSGKPGTFKSWLALDVARAVATGGMFAGLKTGQVSEVCYVDLENGSNLVAKRRRIFDIPELDNFLYWGSWCKLAWIGIHSKEILEYCEAVKPFLIFDSLIRFHNAKENANEEMARVMAAFLAMTRRGATLFLLHHQGKDSQVTSRGAIEIEAAPDICVHIEREPGSREVKLRQTKNRIDEEKTFTLRWTDRGFANAETATAKPNGGRWGRSWDERKDFE